jgi:hypothetical protein
MEQSPSAKCAWTSFEGVDTDIAPSKELEDAMDRETSHTNL